MAQPILTHSVVHDPGVPPERLLLVLHGVFGMGQNFRTLAKALSAALPGWGFVLVDLRGHGGSQGFPAPHTLVTAAADLLALERTLAAPVVGVMGHSFGGKVALTYLTERSAPAEIAVVLDSVPSARAPLTGPESPGRILALLRSMPQPIVSREWFRAELAAHGYASALVDWLGMNVRLERGELSLRLDLDAIEAMLADYFARDLWAVVEDGRWAKASALVIGGQSDSFDDEARRRAERAAVSNPNLQVFTLPQAGHWVHVDDPPAVLAAVRSTIVAAGRGSG